MADERCIGCSDYTEDEKCWMKERREKVIALADRMYHNWSDYMADVMEGKDADYSPTEIREATIVLFGYCIASLTTAEEAAASIGKDKEDYTEIYNKLLPTRQEPVNNMIQLLMKMTEAIATGGDGPSVISVGGKDKEDALKKAQEVLRTYSTEDSRIIN